MIITISGKPGSGKSTLAKRLAEVFGIPRHYIGGLRRRMARERGLTLAEFNKLGEEHAFTDKDVDAFQKELGKKEESFVIEGRTSFHFIPHGIHLFLDVKPREGARRIFSHLQKEGTAGDRNEDENLHTVEDVMRSNAERMESDRLRYKKYYDLDVFNPSHYDLVIDTTDISPDEVLARVLKFLREEKGIPSPPLE